MNAHAGTSVVDTVLISCVEKLRVELELDEAPYVPNSNPITGMSTMECNPSFRPSAFALCVS